MTFELRGYQANIIELLRREISQPKIAERKMRPILCLPTGSGKTVTFSHIADKAILKGSRVSVVCHRTELLQQAKKTMEQYGVDMGAVSFGMVQTYARSPHKIPEAELVIVDECHTGNFRRYLNLLAERSPDTQVIGATATPISASNKRPLWQSFDSVVSPVQISELIEDGYLSIPEYIK
mgnify:CR=1 FL=1